MKTLTVQHVMIITITSLCPITINIFEIRDFHSVSFQKKFPSLISLDSIIVVPRIIAIRLSGRIVTGELSTFPNPLYIESNISSNSKYFLMKFGVHGQFTILNNNSKAIFSIPYLNLCNNLHHVPLTKNIY